MKRLLLLVSVFAALTGLGLATVTALEVQPSQEFGASVKCDGCLQVEPVRVNSFDDLTEPNDLQPALGRNMVQRTMDPQAQISDFGGKGGD